MIRMKYFMALCALFLGVQVASAEYYVLNDPTEREIGTIGNGPELELSGAGHQVTFDGCKTYGGINGLWLQQKIDGSWKDVKEHGLNSNGAFGIGGKKWAACGPTEISPDATHIRFITKTGATLTKYYKNVKVTMAAVLKTDKSSIDFGATELNKNKQQVFVVEHQNVNMLKVSSSNNMVFTPAITTIAASGPSKKGKQVIVVTFNAKGIGVYSGKITVGNGTQTVTVDVKGEVLRKAQTLTWRDDISVVPEGLRVGDAATATSGLGVTYVSDNETVVRVEGDSLIAVAAGTALITAIQAGNEEWAEVSDSLRMEVTTKEVQTITWEQDFYKLKLGDAPVTLNATTTSGLGMTYMSGNDAVVRVDGNVLSVIGVGETTITATQAGDATWAGASLELPVRVREVSAGCDEYALYDPNGNYEVMDGGSGGHPKTFTLNRPADKLTLSTNNWSGIALGDVKVTEHYADGGSKKIGNIGRNTRKTFQLSRNAVKIEIGPDGGTLPKKINNIVVTQATYLETSAPNVAFGAIQVGVDYTKPLVVNHSNLTDIVEVAWLKGGVFTLDGATDFGSGCGSYGSEELTIGITPDTVGEMMDTLVVLSADRVLEIPVSASVQKKTQAISWEQDLSTLVIDDTLALTATASSGLAVIYTSSDESVAVIDKENNLAFVASGTVTITASQEGDGEYKAAQSMEQTVTVEVLAPEVVVMPTVAAITYGMSLADAPLVGGEMTAAGTFAWVDDTLMPEAGDEQTYEALFTPVNMSFYEMVVVDVPVNVARAKQTLEWKQDLFLLHVGDTVMLTATTTSGLDVMYESNESYVRLSGDTLFALASGTGSVNATQEGDRNYMPSNAVSLNYSIVDVDVAILELPVASEIVYGQSLAQSTLTGGKATIEGTFAWADASIRPMAGADQEFEVMFTPAGGSAIVFKITLTVQKAEQTITWNLLNVDLKLGVPMKLTATSSSALPVEYMSNDTTVVRVEADMLNPIAIGSAKIMAKQAGDSNYKAARSLAYFVYVGSASSIDDVLVRELTIYPNPAVDRVVLSADREGMISVYDEQGRLVIKQATEGTQTSIDVQHLPSGRYIVMLTDKDGATGAKMILKQ